MYHLPLAGTFLVFTPIVLAFYVDYGTLSVGCANLLSIGFAISAFVNHDRSLA